MKIISCVLLSLSISLFGVYLFIRKRYGKKLKTETVDTILPATAEGFFSDVFVSISEIDVKTRESSRTFDLDDD